MTDPVAREPTAWPELPAFEAWRATATTVHMWTQVIGKIRLELAPFINHSWGTALYLTPRGITTSPMPYRDRSLAVDFDFLAHQLKISVSDGAVHSFVLEPMSVADFYGKTMTALAELGVEVRIFKRPMEVEEAIPFDQDEQHKSYDEAAIGRFFRALVRVEHVFSRFRARFIGKVSPVHLFWGALDLAVTRFSGRPAPKHPGGVVNCPDWVMQEAYSHEVSSAGFWAGAGLGQAAFYSYAYPQPAGYASFPIEPRAAYFHDQLGEFILPYEVVRTAHEPERELLSFLESTYKAAADLAKWDRGALEREPPSGHRV